jgi:hypothetical protein
MIKRETLATAMAILWTVSLAVLLTAQQSTTPGRQQKPQQQGGEKMSMGDMMKQCRAHYQETANSIDEMTRMMHEARQSNDPARMRAALDQAKKPLEEMKEHMARCMNMMNMMQNMSGGMGSTTKEGSAGQMQGMMSGKPDQQGSSGVPATGSDQMAQTSPIGSCCPPPRSLRATLGIAGIVLIAAFLLSLVATLAALTVFLLRRSRLPAPARV